jgi:hypothetical protein
MFPALLLALIAIAMLAFPCLAIAAGSAPVSDSSGVIATAPPVVPAAQSLVVYAAEAGPPVADIDLTPLLQAALSLAVSLITAFLIPWIRAKYSFEQRQRIAAVYQTVVYAAEQMFGAGTGERKLQWAVEQLKAKGFTVDRVALEAEVLKMQSLGKAILEDGAK